MNNSGNIRLLGVSRSGDGDNDKPYNGFSSTASGLVLFLK
jgi:hypothetical protein